MRAAGLAILVLLWVPAAAAVDEAAADKAAADKAAIGAVLDALHARAAAADYDAYFALFTDEAVFLGSDRDEYWPIAEFKAYTRLRFADGSGWVYHPLQRHVHVAGDAAWFEERLAHDLYGELRGTGVLLREDGAWRIAQYHLTLPIPNALFVDIARDIQRHYGEAD